MSAFTVSTKHVNAITTSLFDSGYPQGGKLTIYPAGELEKFEVTAEEVAQILLDQNYISVNFRYNNGSPAPKVRYFRVPVSALQCLKLIQCLEYQSCETSDWHKTKAFAILQNAKDQVIKKLPGYDEAQYDLE